jgi:hypothetical protein
MPLSPLSDGHIRAGSLDPPKLLAAAPIIALSHELDRHVSDLRRLAPTSDATNALTIYRDKLTLAIQRARQLELFVSADQAAMVLGRSASMITYLCRTGALKAKKVGGTWQIDRLDLERLRAGGQQDKSKGEMTSEGAYARANQGD